MSRFALEAAFVTVALGLAPGAWAEEPAEPFAAPSAAMNLSMGILAPLGAWGAEVELDPLRWLALGVGAGWQNEGPQAAGQVRGRIPLGASRWAITVGGGLAHGRFTARTCHDHTFLEPPNCEGSQEGNVWWRTAEVGLERYAFDPSMGLALRVRVFAGVKTAANPGDVHCTGSCDHDVGSFPYLGLAGGISLPLTSRPTRLR